jgi:hypothetical protein
MTRAVRRFLSLSRAPRASVAGTRSSAREENAARDSIYGWHSGTVERPEPVDSAPVPVRQPTVWPVGDESRIS